MPETFTVIRMALSSELMCAEVGGGLRHRPILNAGFYFALLGPSRHPASPANFSRLVHADEDVVLMAARHHLADLPALDELAGLGVDKLRIGA